MHKFNIYNLPFYIFYLKLIETSTSNDSFDFKSINACNKKKTYLK